jgi:hypothetical protein
VLNVGSYLWPPFLIFQSRGGVSYESREATGQASEDWHSSGFADRRRDFGTPLYALSALIVGVMLILIF